MEEIGIKDIKRITEAIFTSAGVDFSNYAFSSFRRRIMRFVEINMIRDLDLLIGKIKSDKEYADMLVKEITVNVTEMFRDPSFWKFLRDNVFPKIAGKKTVRIWNSACSTGEEVYSMSILLKEAGMLNISKIVATDLNTNVLKVAQEGIYPLKNQEANSKNYEQFGGKGELSDYYTVTVNKVQFDKGLLKNVEFKCHNLAQDGPISEFDLILCRNVLIYFNSELQEKVIRTFDESMTSGSFLGIGSKESIRWCKSSRSFEDVNIEEKIYRKVAENRHYKLADVRSV